MWVVKFNLSTDSSILVNEYQVKHEKMHFFYLILVVLSNLKERGSYNFTHLLRNYGDK